MRRNDGSVSGRIVTDPDGIRRLVYPFVICVASGGSLDDEAFCAGAIYGRLDQLLTDPDRGVSYSTEVFPVLLPLLDLMAMDRGFTMHQTGPGEDGCICVRFDPVREEAPEGAEKP